MEVLIGKSLINGPFSIAMFDYRRVCQNNYIVKMAIEIVNVPSENGDFPVSYV